MTNGNQMNAARPDWGPLKTHLSPSECEDFMWMYRQGEVHFYKHVITRRYLLLDSDGRCFSGKTDGLRMIDFEQEYLRVIGQA